MITVKSKAHIRSCDKVLTRRSEPGGCLSCRRNFCGQWKEEPLFHTKVSPRNINFRNFPCLKVIKGSLPNVSISLQWPLPYFSHEVCYAGSNLSYCAFTPLTSMIRLFALYQKAYRSGHVAVRTAPLRIQF